MPCDPGRTVPRRQLDLDEQDEQLGARAGQRAGDARRCRLIPLAAAELGVLANVALAEERPAHGAAELRADGAVGRCARVLERRGVVLRRAVSAAEVGE